MTTPTPKKSTFDIKGEDAWFLASESKRNQVIGLKAKAIYILQESMFGFYLEESALASTPPAKVYGNTNEVCAKWLNTYNSIDKNLGIFLSGMKGSGKTVAAKQLMQMSSLPTIIINNPIKSSSKEFIESIKDDCIILMDEFEKYHTPSLKNDAPDLLTLLDGTADSHKIYIIISNDVGALPEFMRNRTTRIRYIHMYDYLDNPTTLEIIQDKIEDKSRAGEVAKFCVSKGAFTVDTLCSFLDEINLYNKSELEDIYSCINVIPQKTNFSILLEGKGGEYTFVTSSSGTKQFLDQPVEEEVGMASTILVVAKKHFKKISAFVEANGKVLNAFSNTLRMEDYKSCLQEVFCETEEEFVRDEMEKSFMKHLEEPKFIQVIGTHMPKVLELFKEYPKAFVNAVYYVYDHDNENLFFHCFVNEIIRQPDFGDFRYDDVSGKIYVNRVVKEILYSEFMRVDGFLAYKTDNPRVIAKVAGSKEKDFRTVLG
jgi:hypothetical protein